MCKAGHLQGRTMDLQTTLAWRTGGGVFWRAGQLAAEPPGAC